MKLIFMGAEYPCNRAEKDEAAGTVTAYDESGTIVFRAVKVVDFSDYAIEDGDWYAEPLSEIQSARQEENKAALATWLAAHPLTWVDGKVYGVTEEDQNEMSLNLQQYQVQVAAGRSANLEWHTQKKECHIFTEEQYTALLLAIIDYVYPYRRYQEKVKAAIYAAETTDAVEAVVIDYAGVIVEEGDADA